MNVLAKLAVTLVLSVILTNTTKAQTPFENGMIKALELMQNNNMDAAENMFERIANVETTQWLPNYYVALINSIKSWSTKDEAVLKAQLDKAQEHVDLAMTKSENNAELLVLQAHIYTNWIAYDGMTYGMKYSAKVDELYAKAYTLAPNNPRVAFSKAEWAMGSAKYFGKDTAPYCVEIEKSIDLFTNFKPENKFYPNWGKARAEQVVASCKA